MAKRIAIVEDEAAIRDNYVAAFQREGYVVDAYDSRAPAMQAFEVAGLTIAGFGAVIGSVKAGVVVREGTPAPDISTPEAFKSAVLAAGSLVYNQASSGLYIAQLFERLGIAEAVAARTVRAPTGAAVMPSACM